MHSLPAALTRMAHLRPRLTLRHATRTTIKPLPTPAMLPDVAVNATGQASALHARVASDAHKARQGTLHPWCRSFLRTSEHGPPQAVVLLLHGFTAGPWQYFHISHKLSEGGVDVYAPRLPGHGRLEDGEPMPNKMPGLDHQDRYRAWAEQVYQEAKAYAKARGVPLRLMGFSLGGGLAADLASAHPRGISLLALGAPFLKCKPLKGRLSYAAARAARHTRHGRRYLHINQFHWLANRPSYLPRPLPGYWRFPLSKMFGCLDYNRHLRRRLRPLQIPAQVIITDADEQCDGKATRRWLRQSKAPSHLYALARSRKVGHADLAEVDINGPSHMTAVACRFLLTGEGTSGVLGGTKKGARDRG